MRWAWPLGHAGVVSDRRWTGGRTTVYFADARFETATGRLSRGADELYLRPKTAAVLSCLVRRPGEVVAKRELMEEVWPEGFVGDSVLAVCVNELRRVLADDAREPRYVETVHRRGYRFVAPVSLVPPTAIRAPDEAGVVRVGQRALPFVGRDDEVAELDARWQEALSGHRQLVFVAAHAGVGKTALVDVVVDRIERAGGTFIGRGQCIEQFGEGEAYLPLLEALSSLCRYPDAHIVTDVLRSAAPTWLLQLPALLGDANVEELRLRATGASQARMLREFADAVEVLSARRPLVLVCEDLHDSDRSTAELFAHLARRREPARLLVLGTYRPAEAVARSQHLRHVVQDLRARGLCQHLPLELLPVPAVEDYLVRRLRPRRPVGTFVAEVHQRTEGNALFVETVVDFLLDHDLLEANGELTSSRDRLDRLGVPDSVRQFIERQVESLDAGDRTLLEAAAAAGVEFSVEAVRAGLSERTDVTAADVEARCQRLTERTAMLAAAGAVEWPDGTATARYRFSHAMYQEVLYEHLHGPAGRESVHRRIGRRIAAGYGSRTGQVAAELAMHFQRGRDFPAAVRHYQEAAESALERSAHREALGHTERALELMPRIPAGAERSLVELRLRLAQTAALIAAKGFGSPEVARAYDVAGVLSQEVADAPLRLAVLCGQWNLAIAQADLREATHVAEQLDLLAEKHPDPAIWLQVHNIRGQTYKDVGDLVAADDRVERALALYDPVAHRLLALLYGEDPGVICYAYGALVSWLRGHPDQARRRAAAALQRARELSYPAGLAQALWEAAMLYQHCGDVDRVMVLTAELVELCAEYDLSTWSPVGRILNSWAIARGGDLARSIPLLRHGYAEWPVGGIELYRPYHASLLAEALAAHGDMAAALATAKEGLDTARRTGETWYEAELVRLGGELLIVEHAEDGGTVADDVAAAAERAFVEARAISRRQHARAPELRAATSLARL